MDRIEKANIESMALLFAPVGSRVTCNPPPQDTDTDYLVLVEDHNVFRVGILALGYELGGSLVIDSSMPLDGQDRFSSYVKGSDNLIATQDPAFYRRFMAATHVAKRLNLLSKSDRIMLFQAVLYANDADRGTLGAAPSDSLDWFGA